MYSFLCLAELITKNVIRQTAPIKLRLLMTRSIIGTLKLGPVMNNFIKSLKRYTQKSVPIVSKIINIK